jgi:tRNA pseudouridine32 synthase / 23S rRNA pseudouridine746 synthase
MVCSEAGELRAAAMVGGLSAGAPAWLVHADAWLVVADKPAGLLSVPGRGEDKQDCMARRVQQHFTDALIVHRLDQATSGLLLFARGADMQRKLSMDFEGRRVHKRYVAVVGGEIEASPDWSEIDLPLRADWPNRPRQVVDRDQGKPSLTRWRAVGPGPLAGSTRVELEPVTGRSHQLRVHLQAIGHPIVGDALYAPPDIAAAAPRLLLHASELQLVHPASDEPVAWQSHAPF